MTTIHHARSLIEERISGLWPTVHPMTTFAAVSMMSSADFSPVLSNLGSGA